MDQRKFLTLSAVAASTALWLPEASESTELAFASPASKPRYPSGTIFQLPGKTNQIAWTVDDGAGLTAMHNYIDLLNNTDTRLTFFVTSNNSPWRTLRKELRSLAETGRVQFANHTRSHRDLTKLSTGQIKGELRDCGNFIRDEFGVRQPRFSGRPMAFLTAA
jgi:peptidoglycan/xylan/chitin deacetylase (PgdA/CDA1 family)